MGHRLPDPSIYYRHRRAPMILIRLSQTETNAQGQSTTTVWRSIRANKEDRVARLEWASGGGLGRAVIGKVRPSLLRMSHLTSFLRFLPPPLPSSQNQLPMADLVRRDPRMPVRFSSCLVSFPSDTGNTRTREYSTAPMVSNTDGDQVLQIRTLWWVSQEDHISGTPAHMLCPTSYKILTTM
jgi:hypothetical protein